MKTFLFTLFSFVFLINGFSQTAVLLDSVSLKKISEKKSFKINCTPSITIDKDPLFIVDGIVVSDTFSLGDLNPENIDSINVLRDSQAFGFCGSAAENGAVLITTKTNENPKIESKEYPFKIFRIPNNNWAISQDIYNSIQSKVPNVQITSNSNLSSMPNIRMRGDDNTIVIVDGIRIDASILNSLNPADIENIKVATDAAASNYLINN